VLRNEPGDVKNAAAIALAPGRQLQQEGVDEDHAVLKQVEAEHNEFVIFAAIAAKLRGKNTK
jgi:hypothetical protein